MAKLKKLSVGVICGLLFLLPCCKCRPERVVIHDNQTYKQQVADALELGSKPSRELIHAVTVLGDSKDTSASDLLIKLLRSTDDIALGNACMQALGELGATNALSAIFDFVELKPPVIRRQAIIVARKLATREAAEWLFVMSRGYDDLVTQKEASEALAEVESKLKLDK